MHVQSMNYTILLSIYCIARKFDVNSWLCLSASSKRWQCSSINRPETPLPNLNCTNVLLWSVWGQAAIFKDRQYFQLYGLSAWWSCGMFSCFEVKLEEIESQQLPGIKSRFLCCFRLIASNMSLYRCQMGLPKVQDAFQPPTPARCL